MKFNFKYLILPLSIIACISENCINAMEVEEEINTDNNKIIINSSTINNSEKIIINDAEQEIYNHLFDKDYNKEKYNKLCTECINNINKNKPEYIGLMNNTTKVFNKILEELDRTMSYISNEEKLKVPKSELPKMDILRIINIARQLNIFDDLKDEQDILLCDNSSKKLVKGAKKELISFEELFNYINNQLIKLKYKTLKTLEKSILNTNINKDILYKSLKDISTKNILYNKIKEIIDNKYDIKDILLSIQKLKDDTNTEQIDEFIYDAIYNINKDQILIIKKVQEALNIIPEYTSYLSCINHYSNWIREHINCFDKLYFAKSTFQKRLNNLHTKVIATFNRMSNDNSFNNKTVPIMDNENMIGCINRRFLSNPEDNNTNDLRNIINNILFNEHGVARLNAKNYFRKIVQIFYITKKIMDNKTQRNLIERHDPLYKDQVADIIFNYMLLLYEVVDRADVIFNEMLLRGVANRNEGNYNKYVIQCKNFIEQFGAMYDFIFLQNLKKYEVVLIYPNKKSPEQTVKQVLDNPDEEFIIPYNEVSSLKSKIDW